MNTVIYGKNEKIESVDEFHNKTRSDVFEDYRDNQKSDEVWKLVNGYETIYVSNYGRVRRFEYIIRCFYGKRNEPMISLYENCKSVSRYLKRIVAEAFIENKYDDGYILRYDNDQNNNRVDNLFWSCAKNARRLVERYSDEKWVKVGDPIFTNIEVSNHGRVKRDNIELIPSCERNGYLLVLRNPSGSSKCLVHHLVGIAFIDNPKNLPFVAHIDGNVYNNEINNLVWHTDRSYFKKGPEIKLIKDDYPDEIWKYIPDTKYEISNYGRIRNGNSYPNGTLDSRDNKRYIRIQMNDGDWLRSSIHKLVALAFVPNPNNYKMILHKNGNTQDNRAENLIWYDNHSNNTSDLLIKRFTKYLDETWKEIENYPGYYVSNYGQVISAKRNKLLVPVPDKDGYTRVGLSNKDGVKTFKVHRLVALAFVPKPSNDPEADFVNHKNEIKDDNRACNLEWCDVRYNNEYGNRPRKVSIAQSRVQKLINERMTEEERREKYKYLHSEENQRKHDEVLKNKYADEEYRKYTFRNKIFGKVSNMDEQKQKECIDFIYNYYFMNLLCANNFNFATLFNSVLTQEYLPNNNYFYLYKDENDFANIGVYKD